MTNNGLNRTTDVGAEGGADEGEALLQNAQKNSVPPEIVLPHAAASGEPLHARRPLMCSYALAAWAWRSWCGAILRAPHILTLPAFPSYAAFSSYAE